MPQIVYEKTTSCGKKYCRWSQLDSSEKNDQVNVPGNPQPSGKAGGSVVILRIILPAAVADGKCC